MRILFILLFISGVCYAGEISTPPPLPTEPPQEQHYLKEIQEHINRFDIVTSAPDGSLKGKKGQPVLYNNSGVWTLWINIDNATDWIQI